MSLYRLIYTIRHDCIIKMIEVEGWTIRSGLVSMMTRASLSDTGKLDQIIIFEFRLSGWLQFQVSRRVFLSCSLMFTMHYGSVRNIPGSSSRRSLTDASSNEDLDTSPANERERHRKKHSSLW